MLFHRTSLHRRIAQAARLALTSGLATGAVGAQDLSTVTQMVPPVNDGSLNGWPGLSPDGSRLYFTSSRPPSSGPSDLWVSEWNDEAQLWRTPTQLPSTVNSARGEGHPHVSRDGCELFFHTSDGLGDYLTSRIMVSRRSQPEDPWGEAEELPWPINSGDGESEPSLSPNGLELYFDSRRPGFGFNVNILVARRASKNTPFGEPELFEAGAGSSHISHDGLHVFFGSSRAPSFGAEDIFVRSRSSVDDEFGPSVHLPAPINSPVAEYGYATSPDGMLYFSRLQDTPFASTIWKVQLPSETRLRRGDCNHDGEVDISDAICILGWLFLGGETPKCVAAANTNGDAEEDISDATYLLSHLFLGGLAPVAPFPECGPSSLPTDDWTCATPPANCMQ